MVVWTAVELVWGMMGVAVLETVVVALPLVEVLDVEVRVWVARGLSAGTGTIAPRCLTETVADVVESPDASEPAVACDDDDLTAVPTPKPIASAATSAAPNSHQRRRTEAERAAVTSP